MNRNKLDSPVFRIRSSIIKNIRLFFDNKEFIEVDIPLLTPYPTLDSNIHAISCSVYDVDGRAHPMFLHTSPEHYMKKLLATGAEKVYFLGKVFRDHECTDTHNPEFTMLEWYRTDATYLEIMDDAEQLIEFVYNQVFEQKTLTYKSENIDLTPPFQRKTLRDLFMQNVNLDLHLNHSKDALRKTLNHHNITFDQNDDWETLFFRLFLEKIEPDLGTPNPLFIMDYPLSMALMAKPKADRPDWVERVELYIAGVELANGYSELDNSQEQMKRFQMEQKKRLEQNGILYPIDIELVQALEKGIPPSAGMALGVDRLVMLFTDKQNIEEVIPFPFHQMKNAAHFKNQNGTNTKQ